MNIIHVADMNDFHIKIDSVIYQSVVRENEVPEVTSYLYSSLLTKTDKDKFLLGDDTDIYRFMVDVKPDLVIFHSLYKKNNIKLYFQLKKLNVPYVIRPHGSFSKVVMNKGGLKKKIANMLFFNKFIFNSLGILYLSQGEKSSSYHKHDFEYFLPNMIDCPKINTFNKSNKIIFLGKIEPYYKNIDFIIDVINLSLIKNIKIEMYGPIDKEYKESFIGRIQKNPIIDYKGEIYGRDKGHLLDESMGLILLSKSEGMPMVVLEALSRGTPCFLSEQVNMADYILENEVGLVSSLDVSDASVKLNEFVDLIRTESNKINERCVETARKEFSWSKERIINIYKMVIHKHD